MKGSLMRYEPVAKHDDSPSSAPAVEVNLARQGKRRPGRSGSAAALPADVEIPAREFGSVPVIFAKAFGKLNLERRARLLGRLLGSVGPLALVVIGGGFFAKYLRNARSAQVQISSEDAALATPRQVYDIVRYVEQSNPRLVESLLAFVLQDRMTATAPCA
jgi:hypothetical protein